MMHGLFTRGVNENGKLRPTYEEAPHLYRESELGWIPKEWSLHTLGALADYVNGNSFNAESWSLYGLPLIRIQNINGSEDFNFYEGLVDPAWEIFPNDLLYAWSGTLDTSFGSTLWQGKHGVLNQHIFKVTPKRSLISKKFLYLVLVFTLDEVVKSAHGFKSSFLHVTRSELTSVKTSIPNDDGQERIVKIIGSIDALIEKESRLFHQYKMKKNGLMQDLLSGKVRVKVDDVEEELAS